MEHEQIEDDIDVAKCPAKELIINTSFVDQVIKQMNKGITFKLKTEIIKQRWLIFRSN